MYRNVLALCGCPCVCIDDSPPNPIEEAVESVNPREQGLPPSDP